MTENEFDVDPLSKFCDDTELLRKAMISFTDMYERDVAELMKEPEKYTYPTYQRR